MQEKVRFPWIIELNNTGHVRFLQPSNSFAFNLAIILAMRYIYSVSFSIKSNLIVIYIVYVGATWVSNPICCSQLHTSASIHTLYCVFTLSMSIWFHNISLFFQMFSVHLYDSRFSLWKTAYVSCTHNNDSIHLPFRFNRICWHLYEIGLKKRLLSLFSSLLSILKEYFSN